MFQSTRPRGARLKTMKNHTNKDVVSIHAPAGGATEHCEHISAMLNVSIHAPAGGATKPCKQNNVFRFVSIHAPAGGATLGTPWFANIFFKFQSTRPRGARPLVMPLGTMIPLFQSTRPRGARPCHQVRDALKASFNPRARGGRDLLLDQHLQNDMLFQSTRPRGARL